MNPVLIHSIRGQMREQTTERLLELWTANDRATWSPESGKRAPATRMAGDAVYKTKPRRLAGLERGIWRKLPVCNGLPEFGRAGVGAARIAI